MSLRITPNRVVASVVVSIMLIAHQTPRAGPILNRAHDRQAAQDTQSNDKNATSGSVSLPSGARLIRDVPYGKDSKQRMDIYLPPQAAGAPVILMVHGGAWRIGDKGARAVVENKLAHWASQGFIFISANYRLSPGTAPLEQAKDVAVALGTAQTMVESLGGDPGKFVLMGHSAGAHLVALLGASPDRALRLGAKPWLGTIVLDGAALDVVDTMQNKHARFYDRAFGSDPSYWRAASPLDALSQDATPFLVVCSTRRSNACFQAHRFVAKARSLGVRSSVLEQNLSHKGINQELGRTGDYTNTVDAFVQTLFEPNSLGAE